MTVGVTIFESALVAFLQLWSVATSTLKVQLGRTAWMTCPREVFFLAYDFKRLLLQDDTLLTGIRLVLLWWIGHCCVLLEWTYHAWVLPILDREPFSGHWHIRWLCRRMFVVSIGRPAPLGQSLRGLAVLRASLGNQLCLSRRLEWLTHFCEQLG